MTLFIPPPPRLPSFEDDEDLAPPTQRTSTFSSWPPPSCFDTDPCPPPEFP